jgi:threonyl-tRNA synthetase
MAVAGARAVMPISEKTNEFAQRLVSRLKGPGCGVRWTPPATNRRQDRAHADKIPYMLVVTHEPRPTASVRIRGARQQDLSVSRIDSPKIKLPKRR